MNIELQTRVMRRIYIIYGKNFVMKNAEYALPLAFAFWLFSFVSIQNVVQNLPKDNLEGALNFILAAVENTEAVSQIILAAVFAWSIVSLSRFTYRNTSFIKNINFLRLRY